MDSAKTFEEFKEILKSYEIKTFSKFNVYHNPKGFLDEKREISEGMKLHWKDGLPYFHFGSRIYTCHQGKDKNLGKKQKYAKEKQEKAKSDHIFQKHYNLTQTTKKLDCPVSITVTRVYAMPQFKLENPTKSRKNAVSTKIRNKLQNNEDVEGEEVFWFTLPSSDAHKNHIQGEISAITEPVDPAVRSKIKEFVWDGERNAAVISELLDVFVKTELNENDSKRRRFFPDIPTIKGIIKAGKREIRHSKIDIKNTEKLLETSNINDLFFCPYIKNTMNKEIVEDNYDQTDHDTVDLDHGCKDHDAIPQENHEKIQSAVEDHDAIPQENHEKTQSAVVYGELEKRGIKRRKLIDECNSHMRNLGSVLGMLPESALLELNKDLLDLAEMIQNRVNQDDSTGLPLKINEYRRNSSGMPMDKVKEVETSKARKDVTDSVKKQYGKLKACAKKRTGRKSRNASKCNETDIQTNCD